MRNASVKERFRSLDRVPAPDLWNDIATRQTADLSLGIAWRRVAVAALAFVVAAAGVSVAVRAFLIRTGTRPSGVPVHANGEIWFRRGGGDGPSYVYVIQPDGSGETLLFADDRDPNAPPGKVLPDVVGEEYEWSSDGSELVFSRSVFSENQQAPVSWELFVMSPDAKTVDQVTDDNGLASFPSWSPDGTRIVYSSARGKRLIAGCEGSTLCPSDIYVINADGTGETRLTDDPADDSAPDWSADGAKIVFRSTRDDQRGEIYVMNGDGSGVIRLTSDPAILKRRPVWSPDGARIAFVGGSQVYVMAADGSGLEKVTDIQGNSFIHDVTWSPDGKELAFSTDAGGDEPALFVIDVDGGNLRRLTGEGVGDIAWRPAAG